MKFSVVIPTYNRAELLLETLNSILSQSYPVDEIIIIDDGSTDNTQDMVMSLNEPKINYIQQKNTGQNIARHNGVLLAKNDWIALCDSDDLWHPDHIKRKVSLLNINDNIEFIFSNFEEFGNSSRYDNKFESAPENWWDSSFYKELEDFKFYQKELFYKLLTFTPIFPSGLVFRKSKYIAYEVISKKLKQLNLGAEDFYATLIFTAKGVCASDDFITVKIRKHNENHSKSNIKNMEGEIRIIEEAADFLLSEPDFSINKARCYSAIGSRREALLYHYFSSKDKKEFNTTYSKTSFKFKNLIKKMILFFY